MYNNGQNPNFASNSSSSRRVLNSRYSNIILFVVGIIFTMFGIFSLLDSENTKDWPSVQGVIQDVDSSVSHDSEGNSKTDYRYMVVYTVDNQTYRKTSTSTSYVSNGEGREVAYNPENPNDTRIGKAKGWIGWVVIAVGVGCAIGGVALTLRRKAIY